MRNWHQNLKNCIVKCAIPYDKIPHFPISTVESHTGQLLFGEISGKPVVIMHGRFHYYEGYNAKEITFPIRVLKELGIATLLLSNASGALNSEFKKGELVIVDDHINLLFENPLNKNPLAFCPVVDGKNDLESGADTLCPNPKNEISKKHITKSFFILLNG